MNKNNLSRYFVWAGLLTLLAVFFHIVQSSYNNLITPVKTVENSALLKPINPDLNINLIPTIESRPYAGTDLLPEAPATDTGTPVPTSSIPEAGQ